jgi:hypothetical protein
MADHFVDSTTGNDADTGHDMDLAWATVEKALESGALAAGDYVWVRPIHSEIPTTDISPIYDGTASSPIRIIGWPRAAIPNTTITQADFTNGSKVIDNVVGITINRQKHTNRYITAPDGKQYHITAVLWEAGIDGMAAGAEFAVGEILTNTTQTKKGKVWGFTDNGDTTGTLQYIRDSASTWSDNNNITSSGGGDAEIDVGGETAVGFILSAEYAGATVTGVSGKFQIDADPDYELAQAIDDSTWTIKKTDWDDQGLPLINFNGGAFQLYIYADYFHQFKNFEFKDSADTAGIVYSRDSGTIYFEGCLFKQTVSNTKLLGGCNSQNFTTLKRVIIEGSGAGTSQHGILEGSWRLTDTSILNCGGYGIGFIDQIYVKNVNFGIEMANSGTEIYITQSDFSIVGTDLALGGTNGLLSYFFAYFSPLQKVSIQNYQKILGNNQTFFPGGYFKNVSVGDTNAPSAASPAGSTTDLFAIFPNTSNRDWDADTALPYIRWKIWAPASAKAYTVYIQNNMGVTLNDTHAKENIWLKLTYIDSYDDTTEYTTKELFSTEIDILSRADATDWDSLTIASHTPAVAGWVILELYVSAYVASGQIYVDGKYV